MIDYWLNLPEPALFAALVGLFGTTLALTAWLVFKSPLGPAVRGITGVVPAFFTAISVLFALLTGFLANDVGERNRQAAAAVMAESNAAMTLDGLTRAGDGDMAPIRRALHAYLSAVVGPEWTLMADGLRARAADAAHLVLLRRIGDPILGRQAGAAVQGTLLDAAVKLGAARAERLTIATDRTSQLKWLTVLALGLLTQLSLALVHLENIRGHLAVLILFSTAAVVSLGLIGLQEAPFAGSLQVSPAPLQRALAVLIEE